MLSARSLVSKVLTAGLFLALAWIGGTQNSWTAHPQEERSPPPPSMGPNCGDKYSRTVFFAVLEGLYEDGASTEIVDAVLALAPKGGGHLHFVPECPICTPALYAFQVYRKRPFLYGLKTGEFIDTFGAGLPSGTRDTLLGGTPAARLQTIQGLVQGWVRRRLEALRLTKAEAEAFTAAFEDGRRRGMSSLESRRKVPGGFGYAGEKACAICDAANGAWKAAVEGR